MDKRIPKFCRDGPAKAADDLLDVQETYMNAPLPADSSPTDLHILLVDDDAWALDELAEIVELEGWTPYTAKSSAEALACLQNAPQITLVVTDVHISEGPGRMTNGIDLVDQVKADFAGREIGFVVLSGDADAVADSIESGAVDFLTKPLIPDDLVAALQEAHKSAGAPRKSLTEFLLSKVSQKTKSLQRASVDLEARDQKDAKAVAEAARLERIREDLLEGMREGQILPWLQPQVCIHTGQLKGFEALARWIDAEGNFRSPAELLSEATEADMLAGLDKYLHRVALDNIKEMEIEGVTACEIGINVTAEMLSADNVVQDLIALAEQRQIAPTRVGIEILESAMLDDESAAPMKRNIAALSAAGFSIQLDDFGTGHAGLSSLRDLAVDRVKIDRSFVQDVHLKPKLQMFTRTLIKLAKTLDIEVLAEGVECQEELDWLKAEGCDVVQGFFIAKPMPVERALAWARNLQTSNPTQESQT